MQRAHDGKFAKRAPNGAAPNFQQAPEAGAASATTRSPLENAIAAAIARLERAELHPEQLRELARRMHYEDPRSARIRTRRTTPRGRGIRSENRCCARHAQVLPAPNRAGAPGRGHREAGGFCRARAHRAGGLQLRRTRPATHRPGLRGQQAVAATAGPVARRTDTPGHGDGMEWRRN